MPRDLLKEPQMRAGIWQCEKLGSRRAAAALLDAGRQGCCPAIRGTKGNLNE
jgi:hypothetical protein